MPQGLGEHSVHYKPPCDYSADAWRKPEDSCAMLSIELN